MTGQGIGKGREILSLPLYTVLFNVIEGISRNTERFIFPDHSKLMRIFTFFNEIYKKCSHFFPPLVFSILYCLSI